MTLFAKIVVCLVVVSGAVGAFLFWLADPLYLKAPKDHELSAVFQSNHAAFEKLRQMATEDSEPYISASHLDARLDDGRRQEYKALLSAIRSGLIVTTNGQKSVRFIFAGGGLSAIGSGWLKGIEYLPGSVDREGTIVEELDQPASLATGGVYLRPIEPKWFLIFQKTD